MTRLLATFFGAGCMPFAPGTFGSLAACACGWLIVTHLGLFAFLALTALVSFGGIAVSAAYVRLHADRDDPSEVVIDEVAGQWLTFIVCGVLVGVATRSPEALSYLMLRAVDEPMIWGAGFVCFRLFDIIKPWPINWCDHYIHGGLGIMLDDIVAGVLAGCMLFAVLSVAPISTLNIPALP